MDDNLHAAISAYHALVKWVRTDPVAAMLVQAIEDVRSTSTQRLLAMHDLQSAEAREAHFEAAACGRLFSIMNRVIEDGRSALSAAKDENA